MSRSRNDDPVSRLIEEKAAEAARRLAEQEREARQGQVLDGIAKGPTEPRMPVLAAPRLTPAPRKRERVRRRVFNLGRPELVLAPANVVAVYHLGGRPMWASWGWVDTDEVSARMLPFLQGLDPKDPLPNDPRLALPMTAAGLMLYRALYVDAAGASRDSPSVIVDVYREIAQGISVVDRLLSDVAGQKIRGEVDEPFLGDFAHTCDVATVLLLRAVSFGPEAWNLILRCGLDAECRKGEPIYITRPGERNPHPACRTELSRRRAKLVTPKRRPRKK